MDKLRIDKWLWAARFYKTRTLASEEVVVDSNAKAIALDGYNPLPVILKGVKRY